MNNIKQLEKEFFDKFTAYNSDFAPTFNSGDYRAFKSGGDCTYDAWEWIENNFIPKDEMWARFNEALVTIIKQNKKIREMEDAIKSIRGDLY